MRAVIDANVFVSASFGEDGPPVQVVRRAIGGELEYVVCPRLLGEIRATLARPYFVSRLSPSEAAAFIELIATSGTVADDPVAPPARSRDPKDDYLLALAESTRSVLVTGDRDLLALRDRFPVWTPAQLVSALDAAGA